MFKRCSPFEKKYLLYHLYSPYCAFKVVKLRGYYEWRLGSGGPIITATLKKRRGQHCDSKRKLMLRQFVCRNANLLLLTRCQPKLNTAH